MTDNKFFEMFNDIDEKYIDEARNLSSSSDKRSERISAVSKRLAVPAAAVGAAACIALIFGVAKIRADLRSNSSDPPVSVDGLGTETHFTEGDFSLVLRGTPIPRNELAGFSYDEAVVKCREMLADDEALNAVLADAPVGVEEVYYKARTLAEMASGASGFMNAAFTSAALANPNAAVIEVGEDGSYCGKFRLERGRTYRETGYSYDSFYNALCAVFDVTTVDKLISGYFYEYDGQLYCSPTVAEPFYVPLHTEYTVEQTAESVFIFKTVNYYPNYEMACGGETEYDPEKKSMYVTTEITNTMYDIIGRWRVQEICALGSSSIWKGEVAPKYTLNVNGSEVGFCGVPLPESELESVRLDELYAEYRRTLGRDDELIALFDSLGDDKSGLIDLYCDARALADFVGRYAPIKEYFTLSALKDRTAAYIYDSSSGYIPSGIYSETGLRYGELRDGLERTFTSDGLEKLLKTFPNIIELDGALYMYNESGAVEKANTADTEYVLVENSDSEIAFYVRNFYDYPDSGDTYSTDRVLNRLTKTSSGWRVSEISVYGTQSSAGAPEIREDVNDPAIKVDHISGEAVVIYGEPLKSSELKTELDYSEQYNALRNKDSAAYSFAGEGELVDFLNGLDKEAAEVYLKAAALTDGFARCGHLHWKTADSVSISDITRNFYQTGFSAEAFSEAMRGVFTVEAAQAVPANLNMFTEYNGQLWQTEKYWTSVTSTITNEYELVSADNKEIVFNTRVFRSVNGEEPELMKTINNRIVNTENGWRVAEMCLWGSRSSAEAEINSDFGLEDTRDMMNVIGQFGSLYRGLMRSAVDRDQSLDMNYFKLLDAPVKTRAELDAALDGLLTEEAKQLLDMRIFYIYFYADNSGELYRADTSDMYPEHEKREGRLYLDYAINGGDGSIAAIHLIYDDGSSVGGSIMTSPIYLNMHKTDDGWKIAGIDGLNEADSIADSTEVICGAVTFPLG